MNNIATESVNLIDQETIKDLNAIAQKIKEILKEEKLTLFEASRVIRAIKLENSKREISIGEKVRKACHEEIY